MLPKNRRINTTLFAEVLKNGRSFYSKNISLSVFHKIGLYNTRFAFVVSKKVAKRAVDRNLLRRRGYSALLDVVDNTKPSFANIIFLKKGSESLKFKDFKEEIIELLKKAGVLM